MLREEYKDKELETMEEKHPVTIYEYQKAHSLVVTPAECTVTQHSKYLFYRNLIWLPFIMNKFMWFGFY